MKATLLISCEYFSMSKMDSVVNWYTIEFNLPKIIKPFNFEQRIVDCEVQNRSLSDEFKQEFGLDWETRNEIYRKIDDLIYSTNGKRVAWIYFDELQFAINCIDDYNNCCFFNKMISSITIDDLKKCI